MNCIGSVFTMALAFLSRQLLRRAEYSGRLQRRLAQPPMSLSPAWMMRSRYGWRPAARTTRHSAAVPPDS